MKWMGTQGQDQTQFNADRSFCQQRAQMWMADGMTGYLAANSAFTHCMEGAGYKLEEKRVAQ